MIKNSNDEIKTNNNLNRDSDVCDATAKIQDYDIKEKENKSPDYEVMSNKFVK